MTRSTARSSPRKTASQEPSAKKASVKKASVKKASVKKASVKKASAKKTAEENSPVKKSTARSAAPRAQPRKVPRDDNAADDGRLADASSVRPRASGIAREAAAQLLELTGKEVEGVVGINRTDDGWSVRVEILELRRIPSTTDVLAIYEVAVDEDGELASYRRLQRYVRGTPGED
jgi:hypothetical protein